MTKEGGGDELGRQLQPHLSAPGEPDDAAIADNSQVTLHVNEDSGKASSTHPNWERFDDGDDDKNRPAQSENVTVTSNGSSHQQTAGTRPGSESQTSASSGTSIPDPSSSSVDPQVPPAAVQPPVVYNCKSGEAVVVVPGAVTSSTGSGPPVIETGHISERWREMDRPLTAKKMKVLKILSVVAAILFFPTGIPAAYYAWRIREEFERGIMQGNIDTAQKFARRAERLIILSVILAIVVTVLVLAIVERKHTGHSADYNYVAHASVHGRST